jgi:serine/threonine protein kinase
VPDHPERIGKYEILEELGRGGMGTVYKARDPVLDRVLALKTMSPSILQEPGMRDRFLREARSAARLQHPNIVIIYEFGEVDGAPFIAMEFLEGDDLADAAEWGRLPDLASRLNVVIQLCDGLAYAHRHGVIHRDVKPANVSVLADETIKIVDFGIAWLEGGTLATRTGILLGTPSYMAPEQFAGESVDHRVDQWAAGVILYELLAGRRPFEASTVPSLIYRVLHAALPPLDPVLRLPPRLVEVVGKALAKDREGRFPDMAAMARALREVRDGLSGTIRMPRPSAEERRGADAGQPEPASIASPPGPGVAVPPPSPPPTPTRPTPRLPTTGRTSFVEDGIFGEDRRLQTVMLSPDDSMLVAGGTDGAIHLWDLETRSRIGILRNRQHLRTGHGAMTTCLAFSDDGALLVSGHLDGAVYLWEVASGLELDVRVGHDGAVGGVGIPPGDATLVTGGADATLKFWELPALRKGDARRELRRQPDAINCLVLAGSGRGVVTGHTNRSLRVHETTGEHRLLATIHGHRAPVSVLAVPPAGDLVASGARDGAVRVHHIATREPRGLYQEHVRTVAGLAFFPDGRRLASVAMDNTVVVWDPLDPEAPVTLTGKVDESFAAVCVTRNGRKLIATCADGRFRVWLAPS